ncbi:hypothetical protein B566_EDAN010595 [Ephemera danica]|nr:hypothetical protein B566_EDAN010595 [Ephemera danica]
MEALTSRGAEGRSGRPTITTGVTDSKVSQLRRLEPQSSVLSACSPYLVCNTGVTSMVRASISVLGVLLILAVVSWRRGAEATCVLESDFGFKLNCAFKQSGIFRVRNLGGVKGYLGLGVSLGDELGFGQSLSNLEGNKRRSTAGGGLAAAAAEVSSVTFVYQGGSNYKAEKRSDGRTVNTATVPPFKQIHPKTPVLSSAPPRADREAALRGGIVIPPFKALPKSVAKLSPVAPTVNKLSGVRAQTAFRNAIKTVNHQFIKPQNRIDDAGNGIAEDELATRKLVAKPNFDVEAELERNIAMLVKASNLSESAIRAALSNKKNASEQLQQAAAAVALLRPVTTSTTTTSTTTQRSIEHLYRPVAPQRISLVGLPRVMNAPKEYYPVGYDKDFDDGFKSRVELPPTNFACGDQKHFPGLYADTDLGCMVFHVCALTDDGLIQKSFLCPENTLFDQSVLKCNWWFYVDCTASPQLYDSNIPVSKSYQLMKALSFFSTLGKPAVDAS